MKIIFGISLLLVICAYLSLTEAQRRRPRNMPASCGNSSTLPSRVIGGEDAEPGEFPWMTLIITRTSSGSSTMCGGSLLTENIILTAAHCVVERGGQVVPPSRLQVRLGEHHLKQNHPTDAVVEYPVAKVLVHRGYNTQTHLNDIAMLRLGRNVRLNEREYPVCLPDERTHGNLARQQVTVAGWGLTEGNNPNSASDILQKARLVVSDDSECKRAYGPNLDPRTQICAGRPDASASACKGDSGGPLMHKSGNRWSLVGVVSYGVEGCNVRGKPGVFARVTAYLNWIRTNANNLQSSRTRATQRA